MDFELTSEQELFRGYVRKYFDANGQTRVARQFSEANADGLKLVFSGLADLGATGITIPEEYGGLGLGPLDLVPVLEEMGRVLMPGTFLETMALAVPLLELGGTPYLKEKYLPEIAAGDRHIALAWFEPENGYSTAGTVLEKKGGRYVLNGRKTMVPINGLANAFLVCASYGDGIALLLVDADMAQDIRLLKSMDQTHQLAEIAFSDTEVPEEQLIGEPGNAALLLEKGLLHANAALCSLMVGAMDRIVEMTADYAKIRTQFGQPIGRYQAIKHRIVDRKVDLETARSLSYYANWALDSQSADCESAVYSARAFISEAFIQSAADSIQIHGGIGFTEELDCHLFVKRSRYYENYLGSIRQYREKAATALGW